MDGFPNFRRRTALRRIGRSLVLAIALALPASTSAPALAEVSTAEFAATFDHINTAATAFVPSAGMVDVTAFDPVEEPADEPAEGTGHSISGGVASYYADKFNGRRTASGEAFSNRAMTAAHRTLPFGSLLRVTNPANGKSVVVRVNDRGPFSAGRVLDLSKSAASSLGLVQRGSGRVELAVLD